MFATRLHLSIGKPLKRKLSKYHATANCNGLIAGGILPDGNGGNLIMPSDEFPRGGRRWR